MKDRTLRTEQDKQQASRDLLNIPESYLPLYLTLSPGKGRRTSAANARYWANIEFFMSEINAAIDRIAEHAGYTNLEARKAVAENLPIEHALILYARSKEVVHEVLKQICGIPTSTRLGTKEFNRFSDQLEFTMTQILSEVNAI